MNEQPTLNGCLKCGKSVADDAHEGLCPDCLAFLAADEMSVMPNAEWKTEMLNVAAVAAAFPRLEIIKIIGRGGMGTVFKTMQPELNRLVALKILSPHSSNHRQFFERFCREARLLAKLNHPNIVTIYDFGNAGGLYYLMLEFVGGTNLRRAICKGKISPEHTLPIVKKICEALQFAHSEGIMHRDIKPGNVLISTKGQVKIADFGIGVFKGGEYDTETGAFSSTTTLLHLTQSGQILGTPNYMAPEQLEHPKSADHRADIYSLGVVFYEMLTGELPLGRFSLPSEKAKIPHALDDVIVKALKQNPDERQQSADELKREIETAINSETKLYNVPMPKTSASVPKRSFFKSLCRLAIVSIVVVLFCLLLRGVFSVIAVIGLFLAALIIIGGIALIVYFMTRLKRLPHTAAPALPQFCTHCGNRLPEQTGNWQVYACPKCGFSPRAKRNFCYHCGVAVDPEQIMCVQCGTSLVPSPLGWFKNFWGFFR
ncbi:MAG: protein kinase [Planctomycetaceae bacterium]|jgi:hypothetical protein|nr:protein kinase [Planctomycetaceae bacterium]